MKIRSRYNGTLEVNLQNGRKVLDGRNVNLSYGSVHKIWRDALKRVDIKDADSILILGLGGGSIVSLLRNDWNFNGKITAVELDPVMIRIAAEEFGIKQSKNFKVHEADAFQWINSTRKKFDLVLTDVFIEDKIAPQIFGEQYWNALQRILLPGASALINLSVQGKKPSKLSAIIKVMSDDFEFEMIRKAGGSNTMLLAVKK